MSDTNKKVIRTTYANLPPDEILEANKGDLSYVVLVGIDKKGNLAMVSSESNRQKVIYLFEQIKHKIMTGEL